MLSLACKEGAVIDLFNRNKTNGGVTVAEVTGSNVVSVAERTFIPPVV